MEDRASFLLCPLLGSCFICISECHSFKKGTYTYSTNSMHQKRCRLRLPRVCDAGSWQRLVQVQICIQIFQSIIQRTAINKTHPQTSSSVEHKNTRRTEIFFCNVDISPSIFTPCSSCCMNTEPYFHNYSQQSFFAFPPHSHLRFYCNSSQYP